MIVERINGINVDTGAIKCPKCGNYGCRYKDNGDSWVYECRFCKHVLTYEEIEHGL